MLIDLFPGNATFTRLVDLVLLAFELFILARINLYLQPSVTFKGIYIA